MAQPLPTPSKCHLERTDLAKYRCLAKEANADAKSANLATKAALERESKAIRRETAATKQRDKANEELFDTREERDGLNHVNALLKKDRDDALKANAPLIVENTMFKATVSKLKKQRWILAGVVGVVAFGGGAFAVIAVTGQR